MKITAKTDKGIVRTNNQDSYAAGELSGGVSWAVVCDGMGGAAGGNVASSVAVKTISRAIDDCYRDGMKPQSILNMLESAVHRANACLLDMAEQDESLNGMGTTCVMVLVANSIAYIAHVGDSRAYIVQRSGTLRQITRDHSYVQDLVEQGSITQDEARTYPGKNIITRAVGVGEDIRVDLAEEALEEDDVLLLCTDGLTNFVSDEKIAEIIMDSTHFEYAERLVETANENGGGDNITVVTIAS
ncbi:MAG TPA: Stp1/IreP family PP2C-type Ser/Thr phosphatase [Ruminococcaceae bacterium]|nr:Stp1/IreP family PP2C-type Ser/Thr phosphatase [Oscillospiraceae bacterium]